MDKTTSKIIVAIGMPGSGKTTLLKPLAEKHGWSYVNRDDIRAELFNNASVQDHKDLVWREAEQRVRNALAQSAPVIYDATFAEVAKRRAFVAELREMGWERIIGFYVDTAPEIAKDRNRARDRVVPESELDTHFVIPLQKNPPDLSDGFDELYTLETMDGLIAQL